MKMQSKKRNLKMFLTDEPRALHRQLHLYFPL